MSWQARLLANMEGKQTKDSFNYFHCWSVFLGAGTRHAIKRPLKTQSEILDDSQTQPWQVANQAVANQDIV